jgi:predicted RNA-binding Zn ribbon-like protein
MDHKRQDAPGALETVRQFVNSADFEAGTEALSDPDSLARWLAEHDLLEPRTRATDADLSHALALREALRALTLANNGAERDPEAVATLQAAAERAEVGLDFRDDGSHLEPRAGGVDGALGRVLGAVHEAMHDGTWARLKACPWHTCNWAFYDHTKNRSGVWCTMDVCGNRAKAKAYRERQAG